LFLWASYPPDSTDLSQTPAQVSSIYASLDGVATIDEVLASSDLLPGETVWVEIIGGNHGQFGWYGPQRGDNPATISREEQQSKIVQATLELLNRISDR
jgi:hypothetical protein